MVYIAVYLYVSGMPVAVHLLDETFGTGVKPSDRMLAAALWPLLLPVYIYGLLSVIWGKA